MKYNVAGEISRTLLLFYCELFYTKQIFCHLRIIFLFSSFYKNMCEVATRVTYNQAVGIFGFAGEDHIGKVSFPPVQVWSISSLYRMIPAFTFWLL